MKQTATVHPFPARMAPELAMQTLIAVPRGGVIVDPMMGSGTVIRQATEVGLRAYGFDMDPLAVLMSRVWTTYVDDSVVIEVFNKIIEMVDTQNPEQVFLPWIDNDDETKEFIDYWFGATQIQALRRYASAIYLLSKSFEPNTPESNALDVIRIALSRIIVSKEQCASLARDTSHSRPHKVSNDSKYCVNQGFKRSLKTVRTRLQASPPSPGAHVALGDARAIDIATSSVDAVLTSPPYLNAIDYLRGHRLSLIWLGYKLGDLRTIRSSSIGSERAPDKSAATHAQIRESLGSLDLLPKRKQLMVDRYLIDLFSMAAEVKRILKPGGVATMVVGNSTLKGVFIKNSNAVIKALELQGMKLVHESERNLPNSNRYLPTSGNALAKRMRQETIIRCVA